MAFTASLWDIGLLTAGCALVILLISEVVSPHYGRTSIRLNLKKLRLAAAAFVLVFIAVGIVNIVTVANR
ncbi:MAG TPA: hypothetical protein VGQ03_01480 [Nitrososphaera sp.]|jgi:hypothetical protein|nr:hypothetical protein [Nitrososphaera sp.]